MVPTAATPESSEMPKLRQAVGYSSPMMMSASANSLARKMRAAIWQSVKLSIELESAVSPVNSA